MIMEKKEAMKILKEFRDKSALFSVRTALDTVIPELKESEDEKIRKDIISFLCSKNGYMNPDEDWDLHNKWLPWLENQSKLEDKGNKDKKHLYDIIAALWDLLDKIDTFSDLQIDDTRTHNPFRKIEGIAQERHKFVKSDGYDLFIEGEKITDFKHQNEQKSNKIEPKFKVGDLVEYTNHTKQPIYKVNYIDEECYVCTSDDVTLGDKSVMHFTFDNPYLRLVEQQPADKVEPKFKVGDLIKEKRDKYGDSIIKIEGIDSENYYYFDKEFPIKISEQDNWELVEQKSIDKIEPKFKVGDWIINKLTGSVYQIKNCIENVSNHKYGYDLTDGGYLGSDAIDRTYHLWTIQDAKDGDVIVYEGEIFIIKFYVLWHKIVYHCCYDGKNLHKYSIYDSWRKEDFDKVHPATKEQRELLFSKMKEEGYEWDAENKELKKIEQK